jgi:uncharacterized membrane protein
MHKIIGVTLLVIGVFLLVQAHDLSRTFFSEIRNLAVGAHSARVTYFYLAGAICCAVGLVEFFRSDKK